MKKIMTYSFLIISFLLILTIILLNQSTPVQPANELLSLQNKIDLELSEEIKNENYIFENPKVILNPYENSPLTALVIFQTPVETSVKVSVRGHDEQTTIRHEFPNTTTHLLPIYGLYPNEENIIELMLDDGSKTEIKIQTAPLPNDFTLPTYVMAQKEKLNDDLYFFTPSSTGYTAAYDMNGEVRWYLTSSNVWDVKRLNNGNLLLSSNRTVAPPYYMSGLAEMDLLGKIYTEYNIPGGYHHDVYEMTNGNFIAAANNPNTQIVEDYLVEIDRSTGVVVKEWDLSKIIPSDVSKSENWTETDWFHNNSVWYDSTTDSLILSGRHQDAVISIDYKTNVLNWIIGDSTGWPDELQPFFFTPNDPLFEWQWSQHAAEVLPNGDIFIFDNGNNRSKSPVDYIAAQDNYSRGVIYSIDTQSMTISQQFEYGKNRGADFYSPYISDVDFINPNQYLVHSGGISKINGIPSNVPAFFTPGADMSSITVELLNNEPIFELHLPAHYYRSEKMPLYPNVITYDTTPGKRLGTLGETSSLFYKTSPLILSSNEIDPIYNIQLSKESDRLIFSGEFTEGQKVKLILSKPFNKKVYDIRVSSHAYAAMCIDLFNANSDLPKDTLSVVKYINDEGLSGTYSIYIEIDGHTYNLGQSVQYK
ncbi:MAG: aryl-sulfate sulfotransferase [Turicibacter sp.]